MTDDNGSTGEPAPQIGQPLKAFANRIPMLEQIADGTVLVDVVEKCGECGHEPYGSGACILKLPASAADRVQAVDVLRKAALGDGNELAVLEVRTRLHKTVKLIRDELPEWQAEELLDKLGRVWR